MARDIDDKKTKKALRKLRKAKSRAESEDGPGLTDWEKEFFEGVEERLETFGSAFNDPEKGNLDSALSARQTHIVREIDKKARKKNGGMKRSSFKPKLKSDSKTKTNNFSPRGRDINDDIETDINAPKMSPQPSSPTLYLASTHAEENKRAKNDAPSTSETAKLLPFKVIQGGKAQP